MTLQKYLRLFILMMSVTLPLSARAATNGNPGATSTGSANINVTIPKLVRARSFADFTFATYSGTGNLIANDNLNISSNYVGTYRVTLTGSGAGGTFRVTNGIQNINYTAWYNDVTGTGGRVVATTGVAITNQTGKASTLGSTTLNANLSIRFTQASLQAVRAGTYTGVLTVAVQPE